MKKNFVTWLGLMLASMLASATDLPVVKEMDAQKYAGRWYEIVRLPNRFQEVCEGEVNATYTLRPDGQIEVLNACRKQDGSSTSARGLARFAEGPTQPAKLEVRFAPAWLGFLPFVWGDYWIIDLAEDYSTSLVGTPDRRYLWLLSRTPTISDARKKQLIDKAHQLGFATEQLIQTRQQP